MLQRPHWILFALAVLGCAITLLNRREPFVRNDLVYASAAEHVIEHHFDPLPVVADSKLSHDKPIGFAWAGSPLVAVFGTHDGLRILSVLGTIFFLWAAMRFVRVLDPFAFDDRRRAATLVVVGLNPIVLYQFWSAHPDSWFGGLVLSIWTRSVQLVREPSEKPIARSIALALLAVVALVVKNYALILLANVPLFVLLNRREWKSKAPMRMLTALAGALAVVALVVWTGWTKSNPLVRLEGEGGGVGQYGKGDLWISAGGMALQFVICFAVNLHAAIAFWFVRPTWRWSSAVLAFGAPFVLGLMAFPTSYYNMRYLLPLLPLGALLAVQGWSSASASIQRIATPLWLAIAIVLVAIFEIAPLNALAEPAIPVWIFTPGYGQQGLLDNLRMPLHRVRAAELERIDAEVEPNAKLYLVDCRYYDDAMQHVYERAGFIRSDIQTEYVGARDMHPEEPRFYAWVFYADPRSLERFGTMTELGPKLYRVDRKP